MSDPNSRTSSWLGPGSHALAQAQADGYRQGLGASQARAEKAEAEVERLRGAMASDDKRLEDAAIRVWGEHRWGCDTPDMMADTIIELRAEVERLRVLLHEVETRCDPAGEARAHILTRDENAMLRAALAAARKEKEG